MGTVTVRFFAHLKEIVGQEEVHLTIPDQSSLKQLRDLLEETIPSMKGIAQKQAFGIAVNQEFVGEEATLHDGDEIAFLPPFSGG